MMFDPEIIKKSDVYETQESCLSLLGGPRKCKRYSVINTAQTNGIDVKEYLTNIFRTGERRLPLKSE